MLAMGQVLLAIEKPQAAAACACSHCPQVRCCPCDSVPVSAPVSIPVPSAHQIDVQLLVDLTGWSLAMTTRTDSRPPLTDQYFISSYAVHIYQRDCAYLI
jgi:hypothetical protein